MKTTIIFILIIITLVLARAYYYNTHGKSMLDLHSKILHQNPHLEYKSIPGVGKAYSFTNYGIDIDNNMTIDVFTDSNIIYKDMSEEDVLWANNKLYGSPIDTIPIIIWEDNNDELVGALPISSNGITKMMEIRGTYDGVYTYVNYILTQASNKESFYY